MILLSAQHRCTAPLVCVNALDAAPRLINLAIAQLSRLNFILRGKLWQHLPALLTWALNLTLLFTIEGVCALRFGALTSTLAWLDAGRDAGMYSFSVAFRFSLLRMISFNMDFHWAMMGKDTHLLPLTAPPAQERAPSAAADAAAAASTAGVHRSTPPSTPFSGPLSPPTADPAPATADSAAGAPPKEEAPKPTYRVLQVPLSAVHGRSHPTKCCEPGEVGFSTPGGGR